jgi:S1-C subfamily serine protease
VDQAKLLIVMGPRACFLWQGVEKWLGPDVPAVDPLIIRKPGRDGETSFTLSAAEWRSYTQDTFRLLQQVRTEPVEGGGLRIRSMHEDFPGRRFGLQEGDIVHKVNGKALDSLQVLGDLVKVLVDPQPLQVEIARSGKPVTLSIRVGEAAPKP